MSETIAYAWQETKFGPPVWRVDTEPNPHRQCFELVLRAATPPAALQAGPILSDEWIDAQWAKSCAQERFPALTDYTAAVERAVAAAVLARGA